MTAEQIAALGPAFSSLAQSFSGCFPRWETRRPLVTYGRGLLRSLPRKSVQPIVLAGETAVRTLQEFLTPHAGDPERMRDPLQRRVGRDRRPAPDARRAAAILRPHGQGGQRHRHRPSGLSPRRVQDPDRFRPVSPEKDRGCRPRPWPRRPYPRRRCLPFQVGDRPGTIPPRRGQRPPLRRAHLGRRVRPPTRRSRANQSPGPSTPSAARPPSPRYALAS